MKSLLLVALIALSAAPALAGKYVESFSKVPWKEFEGGRYKASTNADLTATTIAGNLVELKPGGMRELHWHDVAEWAFVLEGTCQATAMDEGKIHPADTWNFTSGDVWYFPANVPHVIIGMAPHGCSFVSGYNSPTFDEQESFSASSWLPTVPVKTLAQALGIPVAHAQKVLDGIRASEQQPTFMPLGNLHELLSEPPSLPVQFPKLIHRFPLTQNTPEVTNEDGSYVNMVDVTRFPVATDMSGALVRIAPGGMRQMHWHLNFDEWQYIVDGTLEVGVFTAPGESSTAVIGAGDLGFAPRGSGHYLKNIGKEMAHVVLIFNAGQFTNVDINNFLGAVPPSVTATSINADTELVETFNFELSGFAPALKPSSGTYTNTHQPASTSTKRDSAKTANSKKEAAEQQL